MLDYKTLSYANDIGAGGLQDIFAMIVFGKEYKGTFDLDILYKDILFKLFLMKKQDFLHFRQFAQITFACISQPFLQLC